MILRPDNSCTVRRSAPPKTGCGWRLPAGLPRRAFDHTAIGACGRVSAHRLQSAHVHGPPSGTGLADERAGRRRYPWPGEDAPKQSRSVYPGVLLPDGTTRAVAPVAPTTLSQSSIVDRLPWMACTLHSAEACARSTREDRTHHQPRPSNRLHIRDRTPTNRPDSESSVARAARGLDCPD